MGFLHPNGKISLFTTTKVIFRQDQGFPTQKEEPGMQYVVICREEMLQPARGYWLCQQAPYLGKYLGTQKESFLTKFVIHLSNEHFNSKVFLFSKGRFCLISGSFSQKINEFFTFSRHLVGAQQALSATPFCFPGIFSSSDLN